MPVYPGMERNRRRPGLADAQVQPALAPDLIAFSPARPKPPPSASAGHRDRIRTRLLTGGAEALPDYELVEMLLFLALPRRDTKPIAKAILARFNSFAEAIAAPPVDLQTIPDLGPAGAAALKLVHEAAIRLTRPRIKDVHVLNNWDRLMDYLHVAMAGQPIEQVRILYLDTRNRLLADQVQGTGTVNHTPVYPRELIKHALALQATALILVHNHPSGDPTPSRDDLAMTAEIHAAAKPLGLALHDHIIVGNGRYLSFRKEGLLVG